MIGDWKTLPTWPGRRSEQAVTTTIAEREPEENTLTIEKLLTMMRGVKLAEDNGLFGATELRCNERMMIHARMLPLPAVFSDVVPDGYIVGMKPGRFGFEVAFILGPDPKRILDASK